MSQNNSQFVVGLLHDHSEFMKPLEEASSAAFHLALDGSGPSAAANCKAAWKFVFEQAIPHMEHEEEVLFPEALDRGMAKEIVSLLETDHRALREIAQDIQKAGLTEESRTVAPEVANLIARFVKIFEWHVEREESLIKLGIAEKPNDESPLPKRKALTAITLFARCEQNVRFFLYFLRLLEPTAPTNGATHLIQINHTSVRLKLRLKQRAKRRRQSDQRGVFCGNRRTFQHALRD